MRNILVNFENEQICRKPNENMKAESVGVRKGSEKERYGQKLIMANLERIHDT